MKVGDDGLIRRLGYDFHVKGWLSIFCALVLSATVLFASFSAPSYARKNFGEDCLSCHQSGITVLTNATRAVQVGTNSSFWLEVSASGGTPRRMMLLWSKASQNSYFSFAPSEVEDDDPNDRQSDGGKITALFKVLTPALQGNYTIRTYAASAEGRGGFTEVKVVVGAGGEIPTTPLEVVMGLLTTVAPGVLVIIAVLGATLYIIAWRRIPGV